MIDTIICPNCAHEKDMESTGEFLYEANKDSSKECGHIYSCEECDTDFEVCIQVSYKFKSYKIKKVGNND